MEIKHTLSCSANPPAVAPRYSENMRASWQSKPHASGIRVARATHASKPPYSNAPRRCSRRRRRRPYGCREPQRPVAAGACNDRVGRKLVGVFCPDDGPGSDEMLSALPPKDGVIGRALLWIAERFWVLRFRLMATAQSHATSPIKSGTFCKISSQQPALGRSWDDP
jgi:hypothetical protein